MFRLQGNRCLEAGSEPNKDIQRDIQILIFQTKVLSLTSHMIPHAFVQIDMRFFEALNPFLYKVRLLSDPQRKTTAVYVERCGIILHDGARLRLFLIAPEEFPFGAL